MADGQHALGTSWPIHCVWLGDAKLLRLDRCRSKRAAPIVLWIALAILLVDLCVVSWLAGQPELPVVVKEEPNQKLSDDPEDDLKRFDRFSIRSLLLITALVAVIVAAQTILKAPLASRAVYGLIGYALWLSYSRPAVRWPVLVLLVCMWGPFAWTLNWPEFQKNGVHVLHLLTDSPALLLAGWLSMLMRWNIDNGMGSAFALLELAMGLWIVQHGPKRGLTYTLAAFTLALFSSFGLHALVRA